MTVKAGDPYGIRTRVSAVRGPRPNHWTKGPVACAGNGDPYGIRTRVSAVKGPRPNHWTNGPCRLTPLAGRAFREGANSGQARRSTPRRMAHRVELVAVGIADIGAVIVGLIMRPQAGRAPSSLPRVMRLNFNRPRRRRRGGVRLAGGSPSRRSLRARRATTCGPASRGAVPGPWGSQRRGRRLP